MKSAITITPTQHPALFPLREVLRYRDLLYFLTWRDIKVRYKQTVIGSFWAILQPFLQMVVFSIFFGRLAKIPSEGVPYPVFVYAALLPWTFFANSLSSCANSAINNAGLIRNVYFPRLITPLSAVASGLIDFLLSFLVLFAIMIYYHFPVTVHFLMIVPLLCGVIFSALGIGTLLAALSVSYRDFRHIVPFMLQIWLFLTPVIYPPSIIGSKYQFLLNLNPMAGLINGFRSAILGRMFNWHAIALSFAVAVFFFIVGNFYFARVQSRFADLI